MRALDFGNIDETGAETNKGATWKVQLGDGLEAAFIDRACTVCYAGRVAGEEIGEVRMVFQALSAV